VQSQQHTWNVEAAAGLPHALPPLHYLLTVQLAHILSFNLCGAAAGSWRGQLVAVKVVAHTAAEEGLIGRELKLAADLRHPRLVGMLHWVRLQVSGSHATGQVRRGRGCLLHWVRLTVRGSQAIDR
jgi:uncharacterized protein (DUF2062 family)